MTVGVHGSTGVHGGPRGALAGSRPPAGGALGATGPSGADTPPLRRTLRDTSLLRRVTALFRPYRRPVLGVGVLILITAGLGTVNPLLIRNVFDTALFVPGGPRVSRLVVLVALMSAIPVVTGALGVWQTYLTTSVGQRVMQDLRGRLYAHLQDLPLRFFTATRTGEIQSRLANDVGGLQAVITDTASSVLTNIVILISTLIAMLLLSWQLTVLSVGLLPIFTLLTVRVGTARRRVSAETQKALAEMSAITEETLSVSGVLLAKVFGRQTRESARYAAENARLAHLQLRQVMIGRTFFAVVSTFFSVTPAVTYLLAGLAGHGSHPGTGAVSSGTLVAITTLQSRLFFPIGQLLEISTEVSSSLALFSRVFGYLDLEPEIVEAAEPVPLPLSQVRGVVELDDVRFRYAEAAPDSPRPWALDGVSLRVEPGQLAAIVGPSGAGKTTISYLLPRLYDVTSGAVRLDGHDVRDLALADLTDAIGMVTQESYLFHASIRDNLAYARPDATEDQIEAAARAANIHDRIMEFDAGYDTVVGERGYRLSGGEKQRLAIARVLLKDPTVLVLDEATSALDTANERLVQAALEPLMAGRTTIAIAHRLSTILAADVIFVLDRGRLVESGSHTDLLAADGVYARLYRQQFGDGMVEARCADGFVLRDGHVLSTAS